ncbi:MAG: HlyC/CorC family transporter [Gammaproteobacteria bacterium]|nr:MAG: HlyC/CorC family transporter [Gammaproteobacteria bacterium]
MNDDDPDSSSTSTEPNSRSLLDRIGQALLGEPGNRKELIDILRDAQHRNLLSADDLDMIEGVFQVSEMQVRDIMIPRAQMDVVDRDQEPEEYLPEVIETAHSRFPMIDDDKDKIIGILLAKDLLRYFYQKDKEKKSRLDIEDFLRPAVFVPESKRLNVLLREFRTSRNHMAIVVNEYGGVAGLVTIEDVLEQIVGEIADEHDIDGEDVMIMPHDHGECTVKALTSLEEFNAHFGTRFQDDDYETVAGLIMTTLGHLPERGEKVLIEGLQFEVLRADSRRIHILKVKPVAKSAKRA